jgi:hypothetical protein
LKSCASTAHCKQNARHRNPPAKARFSRPIERIFWPGTSLIRRAKTSLRSADVPRRGLRRDGSG